MAHHKLRHVAVPMVFVGALFHPSCYNATTEDLTVPDPIILALAIDLSGSMDEEGFPSFTEPHLIALVDLLRERGGSTLGVAFIDDQAFEPVQRLELTSEHSDHLDEQAYLARKNRAAYAEFHTEVSARLRSQRAAKRSDVKGCLRRLILMLNEPTHPREARKILVVFSDGIHTGKHFRGRLEVPEDVQVLTCGMDAARAAQLFGAGRSVSFESVTSVVRYLQGD